MTTNGASDAILAGLRVLAGPGSVVELRVPKAGRSRVISGYFDDLDAMTQAAEKLSGRYPGIYFTANPAGPVLLARAANRVAEYAELTTADRDVASRRWLPIDLDPVRPSGISASDEEHEAARQRAREIRAFLIAQGWPEPVVIDSGNGCYVLPRIDLPNDEASRQLAERVLKALAFRFDDDLVHVDQTMFNAARIIRIPGTLNCKGDSTADRPHREARILHAPEPPEVVPLALLQALAATVPQDEPGSRNGHRTYPPGDFDLERFVSDHLDVARDGPWQGTGYRWILRTSPLCDHGGDGPYVLRCTGGGIKAGCHHDSCRWTWAELREKFEPGATDRKEQYRQHERGHDVPSRQQEPPPGYYQAEPPPLEEEAAPTCDDWRRQDLGAILRGEVAEIQPAHLATTGGHMLLYPGLCHWISGEPEGMKSWLAQIVVAETLIAGGNVLYLDFESDANTIVSRLLALGVSRETIEAGALAYIRPGSPLSDEAQAALVAEAMRTKPTTSVIDGVNAGMGLCGLDPNGSKDFTTWWTRIGRPVQLQTSGPTVAVDHVVKDPEKRSSYAYGSVSKLAVVDGAHFGVMVIAKFGRGLIGKARLLLHKDRPGFLRGMASGAVGIADLTLTSDAENGGVTWELEAYAGRTGQPTQLFRPTHLMQHISEFVESEAAPPTQYRILEGTKGKRDARIQAIKTLVAGAYLIQEPGARVGSFIYRSEKPYREADDPSNPPSVPIVPLPFPDRSPGNGQETVPIVPPPLLERGERGNGLQGPGNGQPFPEHPRCPRCRRNLFKLADDERLWCGKCMRKWAPAEAVS